MKKSLLILYFFLFQFHNTFAHKEVVHQYMTREAYKLLRDYLGQDITELLNHLGYEQQGNGQFYPGGLIVIGAYQEDHSDATNEGFGLFGWTVSNTHFWDPDMGDGSHFMYAGFSYSNAYQKAKEYIYGGYELRVPYPANEIIEAYEAPSNIFQFYKDRRIFYKGYYNIMGRFIPRNYWTTVSVEFRDKIFWEIIGRISHLLGDMTVPAHVHNDPHPVSDSYEDWMGSTANYQGWSYLDAINQGGIIDPSTEVDPVKYLFYPTAQIAGFFSSDDVEGNISNGINDPFNEYDGLPEMMQSMIQAQYPQELYFVEISDFSFTYGIRGIAGFYYWMLVETDLLPKPLESVTLVGNTILWAESTGRWSVNLQEGIEPFTYNWQKTA